MSEGLQLKVCGMRDAENIRSVAAMHPDYLGFIFYDKSPRWVGPGFVIPELEERIKKVGVFVNATNEEMLKFAVDYKLDFLQLHGDEPVEQVKLLAETGTGIWKAFSLDEAFDFQSVEAYTPYVNMFLFDTRGKHYGGNARTFDWTLLQKYDQRVPFMLSGGLNARNVPLIRDMKGMNLRGIDVNSGVESTPGVKDPEKLKEVITGMKSVFDYN
jgi:phosphoribosylanthranilate isomerase